MQDGSWSNEKMNRIYNRILIASCTANASQAIFANMTALLMVPFMSLYGLTLGQMGILVGINFGTQILADVLLTFIIDNVKYKNLLYVVDWYYCVLYVPNNNADKCVYSFCFFNDCVLVCEWYA